MAITLVGTPQMNQGGVASLAVNKPTGVASGDVLLCMTLVEDASSAPTVTQPAGWVSLGSIVNTSSPTTGGGSVWIQMWRKVAGGSEPGSYTFGFSTSSWNVVLCAAYHGVDNTTPIDASSSGGTGGTGNVASFSLPAVTTTAANDELVIFAGDYNGQTINSTGFTSEFNSSGYAVLDKAAGAAGSYGPSTATFSASDHGGGWLIALLSAGAGGGSTVNGSAIIQANAALVGSAAQVVEPSGTIPTPANATLALSGARVVATGPVSTQANAALVETAQIVASPPIAMQANAVLAATGGLAGQGGGIIVANAALVETAARIQATTAIVQASATLVVTGRVVTPSPVALAASSVLALAAAQVRAAPTAVQATAALSMSRALLLVSVAIQANAVLVATGHIPLPVGYKSPTGTTALHATLTGSTTAGRLTGTTVARAGLTGSTVARPLTGSTAPHTTLTGSTVKE